MPSPPPASRPRLAVVGAGPAGLAAAVALGLEARVTVFEKSRGVSGRAATRWRDAPGPDGEPARWRYDHGAQYLSPDADGRAAAFVREHAGAGLTELGGAVWPFDAAGVLHPDEARQDPGPRWTYPDGVAGLGKRLVEARGGLDVRLETRVARLERGPDGWGLEAEDGGRHGGFDAVLLTAPAPQTAALLEASDLGPADAAALLGALGGATYRSQFAVVWAFEQPLERPADVYALVHAVGEGEHPVAWLAVESDKPGRAPAGGSILLAQMSDAWTRAHYDADRADVVAAASEAVEALWGALPAPLFTDTQRWRYSLPDGRADRAGLEAAAAHGLFFAGDYTAGRGRVHLALEEGLGAADRIRRALT